MLMCEQCLTIYKTSTQLTECPRSGCEGNLVYIDDEIDDLIADLNDALWMHKLPIRTRYSCAGHGPKDISAYIGFDVETTDEKVFGDVYRKFAEIAQPLIDNLNAELHKIKELEIVRDYDLEPDILELNCEDCNEFRMFINHIFYKYKSNDYQTRWHGFFNAQTAFRNFLVDLITAFNSLPDPEN